MKELLLDYSDEAKERLIEFLDAEIERETNLLARSKLIESREMIKTDDRFFRFQIDFFKGKIRRGEYDAYKIPLRKN